LSLESARKLGLTASLINVIVPVITVTLYAFLIFSLLSGIFNSFQSGFQGTQTVATPVQTPPFNFSAFSSLGILSTVVGLLGLVSFVGFILFVVAMYQLSHYYNEPGIFKNTLNWVIVGIVGTVAVLIVAFVAIFSIFASSFGAAFSGSTIVPTVWSFIIAVIVVVASAVIISVISSLFLRRAFNKLAEKSGVHSFNTAGMLFLVGSALTIVGIGSILIWIAWIFAASGFRQLKSTSSVTSSYQNQQYFSPNAIQKTYCPNCGAENKADSIYCGSCGKKLL
jgi:uncharacterized membrane protein